MNNLKGTSKEIGELAKRIVPILRDNGVVEASVFGSFTRGEARNLFEIIACLQEHEGIHLKVQAVR